MPVECDGWIDHGSDPGGEADRCKCGELAAGSEGRFLAGMEPTTASAERKNVEQGIPTAGELGAVRWWWRKLVIKMGSESFRLAIKGIVLG